MAGPGARITFLTEYFHPEEASTAQLMTELATALNDEFDVTVLTAYPKYHGTDRGRSVPRRSSYEGVDVIRSRSTRFDKDRFLGRIVNWITFTILTAVRVLSPRSRTDLLFVLSNPPILPAVGWLRKRLYGTPYVYLVYDVYPEMAVELGLLSRNGFITRFWKRAMRIGYRDADRIVVLGESMKLHLEEVMADDASFDPGKVAVIHNWEDDQFIRPMDKSDNAFAQDHDTTSRFTLLYSGNVGRFHDLETAIDAIDILEERGRDDIQLLVIGEGARKDELKRYVAEQNIELVKFLPFQPLERLPETLTCGDASLVGVKPGMAGLCVSSKLYSALAAGLPVLAIVDEDDEVARVVTRSDCGVHVTPGNSQAAADALVGWADSPELAREQGTAGRSLLEEKYTLDGAVAAYTELFESVLSET